MSKPKVLIVDDEKSIRDMLELYLQRKNFRIFQACSGEEAIESYSRNQPDIVLLDILMPGWNGIQTLTELKRLFPQVKTIVVSAIKNEETYRKCLEIGAGYYVSKPIDLSSLDTIIMGMLLRG